VLKKDKSSDKKEIQNSKKQKNKQKKKVINIWVIFSF
jgi:hypothetical protein